MAVHARQQTEYSLIDFLIENELEYIKNYITDQSKLLRLHEQNVEEMIEKETTWVDGKPYLPFHIDTMFNSSFFTYNIFHKSTFITLYSFLESLLKEISRIERDKSKLKISPKDLKGQGVLQYKDYLTKVIQIDFDELTPVWTKVNEARIVRNYLVHDYLDYSDRTEFGELEKISKASPYISFDTQNRAISITDAKYLLEFCATIELFINSLLRILKENR